MSILRHQRALATVLLIVLFPVCFCLFVNASSGDFDSAFGGTGKVITDFGATTDYGDAVVLQPDGKIVIAGTAIANYAAPDQRSNFALARYNANGSLDDSFGAGGRVITDFNGGEHDGVGDMVLQSDGRLVVAGSVLAPGGGGIDLGLARYLSDGSLDPNFGSSGKVATHLSGRISGASGMVLQPDGKLVIAGQTGESTRSDIAVVRYNNNGSLDTSFGNGGQVTTHFDGGSNVSVSASDIALQPDGKIVVAGHYIQDYSVAAVFALARYNSDGSLDSGFADGGKLITNVTGFASGVVVQPDGK
ncbi:MAG TPA: delta-60 repeat domain-containing protein, partial [Pyrinomonadaceae bacterium]|nr:delta-60 repeat domain-containing protein [Pyrinomonadaceae bacterium]